MNTSLSTGWVYSSVSSPCPICARTKDGDCSWNEDGDVATLMCHTAAKEGIIQNSEWQTKGEIGESGYTTGMKYTKRVGGWIKPPRSPGMTYFYYPNAKGENLCRVARWDKPDGQKMIWQEYWIPEMKALAKDQCWVSVSKNKVKNGKASQHLRDKYVEISAQLQKQIHLYQINHDLNVAAKNNGDRILIVEGEGLVEALLKLGIPATCPIGGSGKWGKYGGTEGNYLDDLVSKEGAIANVVLCPDRDTPGVKHCETIEADLGICQWLYASGDSPEWYALPGNGGFDLKDWIESQRQQGLNDSDIKNLILDMAEPKRDLTPKKDAEEAGEGRIKARKTFYQQIFSDLYGDKSYICISGEFYKWEGTHYEKQPKAEEEGKIWRYCNEFIAYDKNGDPYHPFAEPSKIKSAIEWIRVGLSVSPERVNPPGINCTNGILRIRWKGSTPSWGLIPHDPNQIYVYKPRVTYNPQADSADCDRLLSALDGPHREIFLRTVAASLDLEQVRRYKGRGVKALLLKGDGNNGKDTLREAVSLLYGKQGITGCSMSDFKQYDEGRKFPLSKLEFSRINWASENSKFALLDQLQSLKIAITGDDLDFEPKQKDERSGPVKSVFFFNINEAPSLKASLEAIKSRYAILSFDKTFKVDADPARGEIEADSRFKYDPCFMENNVLSALLNKVLKALKGLMKDGIDYSSTLRALEEIQCQSSHLYRFTKETGLIYCPGDRVSVQEIWQKLEDWYLSEGIVEHNNVTGKATWQEPLTRSDKFVKGANQIVTRFSELFPKSKKVMSGGRAFFTNLSWQSQPSHPSTAESFTIENNQPQNTQEVGSDEAMMGQQVGSDYTDPNSINTNTLSDTVHGQKANIGGGTKIGEKPKLIENDQYPLNETEATATPVESGHQNQENGKTRNIGCLGQLAEQANTETIDIPGLGGEWPDPSVDRTQGSGHTSTDRVSGVNGLNDVPNRRSQGETSRPHHTKAKTQPKREPF